MMRAALALARRSLGSTWPNPAVGCVIVRDGKVIGRGRTQKGGRPHAETQALAEAGAAAAGATVYVTLEPCAHHGRTPPCADALVEAGVARVVSALEDPDPRVMGQGHARLRAAGIAVEVGEGGDEAREINAGFLTRVAEGRPLFRLKMATSLDGRIATASGESQWITGEASRRDGHRLRATHDAILVGSATALADNPSLTCRLPGMQDRSPVRIVLDSRAGLALDSVLATTARQVPVWVMCTSAAPGERRDALRAAGVEIMEVPASADGRIDVPSAARALGERGLTRVLIEGGGQIAAAFLRAGLVDRITSYRAGVVLGAEGRSAVGPMLVERLGSAPRFRLQSVRRLEGDTVESWTRGA